jgi:serine/threonine protein kinase
MGNDNSKIIKQQEEMIRDLQQQNKTILGLLAVVYQKMEFEKDERLAVTIEGKKYEFKEKLGQGAFGIVYKGVNNNKIYAIKQIEVSEDNATSIMAELKFIVNLRKAFTGRVLPIISVYGVEVVDKRHLYYVMELAETALSDFYTKLANDANRSELSIIVFLFILRALLFLESIGIVHRDIKPENFVVVSDPSFPTKWNIKLIDFGTVKQLDIKKTRMQTNSIGGTPAYIPPEAINGVIHIKSDVWSLGIMLYRLIYNDFPDYIKKPNWEVVLESDKEIDFPKCPPKFEYLHQVMIGCLAKKPEKRASASHLYEVTMKYLPEICKIIIPDPYINDKNIKNIHDSLIKNKNANNASNEQDDWKSLTTMTAKKLSIKPKNSQI